MSDIYKVIEAQSEGIYKEKGSKFLAFAIPVNDADEIRETLETYRKRFFDARHVCYAYMLGQARDDYRANDDGEPSGTAGRPILGQINSYDLTNILVIVVRYFGGILLGTSGLITAYKEAAAEAINNALIIEKTIEKTLTIHFPYELMSEVSRIMKEFELKIESQQFEMECEIKFAIPQSQFDHIKGRFAKIYGLDIAENHDS